MPSDHSLSSITRVFLPIIPYPIPIAASVKGKPKPVTKKVAAVKKADEEIKKKP